ncbi:MAG: SCP2 sterol-binding domain-containing protein [Lachnospiraceae bacterium]|nr:SCP2 sterol-binding domain-containing protein [Lachnospiraceae bacterium]
MTYEELVATLKEIVEKADASKIKEHVAFQFNVEGEASGALYLEVADGKAHVEPYEYYDRDILVTTSAETLINLVSGKLDPVKAYLEGKIKAEGNLGKASILKEITGKKKGILKRK